MTTPQAPSLPRGSRALHQHRPPHRRHPRSRLTRSSRIRTIVRRVTPQHEIQGVYRMGSICNTWPGQPGVPSPMPERPMARRFDVLRRSGRGSSTSRSSSTPMPGASWASGCRNHQRHEVRGVVRHEHIPVPNRPPDEGPVLPGPQPEPGHVRRLGEPSVSSDCRERRAQAFVDREFHRHGGRSSKETSLETIGFRLRQEVLRRGRPRRG